MKERTRKGKVTQGLQSLLYPVLALISALAIGAVLISAMGFDWVLAYKSLLAGSFGNYKAITESLVKATPLIFTGISFAMAQRCGMINLGAEGQVYMGGLFGSFVALGLQGLPRAIHLPLTLVAGFVGGGLLGLLIGFLKVRFGASELIVGIMFNYIAIKLVSYMVTGPMKEPPGIYDQTAMMPASATLPRILPDTRLTAAFLLAVASVLVFHILFWKTTKGYEMRCVGLSATVAEYSGIRVKPNMMLAMSLSGGFAGLGGCCDVIGVQFRLLADFSPQYGFDGIAVALLGGCTPLGVLLSGILLGALKSGSNTMKMLAQVPVAAVQIIQALIIIFVVGREIYHITTKRSKQKMIREQKGV